MGLKVKQSVPIWFVNDGSRAGDPDVIPPSAAQPTTARCILLTKGEGAVTNPDDAARAATLTLLAGRAEDATVCPSEVARSLAAAAGSAEWRAQMPTVHTAVDRLLAEGAIRLSWKGARMAVRDGPYRIGKPERDR